MHSRRHGRRARIMTPRPPDLDKTPEGGDLVSIAKFGTQAQDKLLYLCHGIRDALHRKDEGPACDSLLQIKALLQGFAPRTRDLRGRANWWERLWRTGSPKQRLTDRYHSIQTHIDRFSDDLLRAETQMRREIGALLSLQKQADSCAKSLSKTHASGGAQLALIGHDHATRAALDWRVRDLGLCKQVAQHCLPALLPEQDQDMALVRAVHKVLVKDLPLWEQHVTRALGTHDARRDQDQIDIRAIINANAQLDRALQHALDTADQVRDLRRAALVSIGEIIRVLSQAQATTAARLRGLERRS